MPFREGTFHDEFPAKDQRLLEEHTKIRVSNRLDYLKLLFFSSIIYDYILHQSLGS